MEKETPTVELMMAAQRSPSIENCTYAYIGMASPVCQDRGLHLRVEHAYRPEHPYHPRHDRLN